ALLESEGTWRLSERMLGDSRLATRNYNPVMHRSTRRLIVLAAGLVAFVLVVGLIYQLGMLKLEGKPRTFWRSLEWAVETISTTGFGSDNQWTHPAMVLFVILIEIAGILLVPVIVS